LEKLETVLKGFEDNGITPLFIMIGSFFSKSYYTVNGGKQTMKNGFQALSSIIGKFPLQCSESKFLLIPGPLDGGLNTLLPRHPIPSELVQSLESNVKHMKFGSNPCRLRCFTQEFVIYREDLLRKMQRHLILPLDLTENAPDITQQLAESILDQAHLAPLPLHARPIIWELDYNMRLFPLPHIVSHLLFVRFLYLTCIVYFGNLPLILQLVLADKTEQYSYGYQSCDVMNPGKFPFLSRF
jgi:DNA polymerase epsilon subunit 2